jgi:hypothetical protein
VYIAADRIWLDDIIGQLVLTVLALDLTLVDVFANVDEEL